MFRIVSPDTDGGIPLKFTALSTGGAGYVFSGASGAVIPISSTSASVGSSLLPKIRSIFAA